MQSAEGLEYTVEGRGDPVLLIHGSVVADAFLPLSRESELRDHFRLIRYHRRGLGGSIRHTGPFTIKQQAQDALLLVQELGIDRLHVVGHSYGAVTALQLALQAPQAVHSLVLLEPPLGTSADVPARSQIFAPLIELYRSGDPRAALDAFMQAVSGPGWQAAVESSVPGSTDQACEDAAALFEVEVPALLAWGFEEDAARGLTPPVLFGIGSESGELFEGPRRLFMSAVGQAEDVVLPGLDHLLQMRDSGLVARPIAEFLTRHPL